MEKKKKIAIGIIAVIAVAAIAVLCFFLMRKSGGSGKDKVYVEKVSEISGSALGSVNRYAGVIEAQDSWKINKDGEKEVKEVLVQVGDEVKEGDDLFSYNTDATASEIDEKRLDLENINNEISDCNTQIASLSAERDAAPEESKFDYTTQIQSVQNDLKQAEYDRKSKQLEIDKLNETIANSVVKSKMDGVVKSINNGEDGGEGEAFITILSTGNYRVKCLINEQNMSEIAEGSNMLIHSRVDEKKTWEGTIAEIDKEAAQTNTNEYSDSSSDETVTSSKYPFYIALENSEGLMLGQHVYVENNEGQSKEKKGIWLLESYLVMDGDDAYVWADNGKGKLEKRKVELGKYDEELGEYKIKSGLKEDDYIAWPMENLYEGVDTVTDMSEVDYDSPLYKSQEEEDTEGDGQEETEGENPEGDGQEETEGENPDGPSGDIQPLEDAEPSEGETQEDFPDDGEGEERHILQGEEL